MKLFLHRIRIPAVFLAFVFGLIVLPFVALRLAVSADSLHTTVSYAIESPKNYFMVDVNTFDAGVTDGTLSYALHYRNENEKNQIESFTGSSAISAGNFSKTFDAATCSSGGTCVSHTVSRGIVKTAISGSSSTQWQNSRWFTVSSTGQITYVYEEETAVMDSLNKDEEAFLLRGTVPKATPTTTPTKIPPQSPLHQPNVVQEGETISILTSLQILMVCGGMAI